MKKTQSGFTLIEIAIVMVIIGLLLGGVLKGQSMINSAKVRSLNNKIDGISAAWFAFQDRYRALPGDMIGANAAAQIGNGILAAQGGDGFGTVNTGIESGFLWLHLAGAGFISGSYSGAAAPGPAGNVYECPTGSLGVCPDNGFGLGMEISFSAVSFPAPAAAANTLYTGSNIPVVLAAELDRKIDDGIPITGAVRGGASNGALPACVAGGIYNIAVASMDCGLATRNL